MAGYGACDVAAGLTQTKWSEHMAEASKKSKSTRRPRKQRRGKLIAIEAGLTAGSSLEARENQVLATGAKLTISEKPHRRWQGGPIKEVLKVLFPPNGDPPPRDELADADLVQMVHSYMAERPEAYRRPLPSPETVLREAGRKQR